MLILNINLFVTPGIPWCKCVLGCGGGVQPPRDILPPEVDCLPGGEQEQGPAAPYRGYSQPRLTAGHRRARHLRPSGTGVCQPLGN